MQTILLNTKQRPSEVLCGEGAFAAAREYLAGKQAFVVTDKNVYGLYADAVADAFPAAQVCVVPAGERHKNRTTLFRILDQMFAAGLHRGSFVVALGGGVVGDMAGLAAALYMRGTRLVQVPTTLLAQVDSSVGGKTAVDYRGVKNAVGTFYQPERVFADPLFLHTLPAREVKCGLGEIVKTGILDAAIGDKLGAGSRLRDVAFLQELAADCIRFKARVVEADETETQGLRKCLNLGHTTGHALELLYGRRSHGEYVLIGLWLESLIAEREGVCSPAWAEEVRRRVAAAEPRIPAFRGARRGLEFALHDKKNAGGGVSLVLPKARGEYALFTLSPQKYGDYLALLEEGADARRGYARAERGSAPARAEEEQ